jgi:hypothetical protein
MRVKVLGYLSNVAKYNLLFHPLQKVPGPKLYAISRISWTLDFLSGSLRLKIQRLYDIHAQTKCLALAPLPVMISTDRETPSRFCATPNPTSL